MKKNTCKYNLEIKNDFYIMNFEIIFYIYIHFWDVQSELHNLTNFQSVKF